MAKKQTKLVTRASIQKMLDNPNPKFVEAVVGRALWAIFQNQTEDEKSSNETRVHNNIGFSGADAKSGSLTAKFWKRNGYLAGWQIEKWTRRNEDGFSRLTKYHRQLNDIAIRKEQKK